MRLFALCKMLEILRGTSQQRTSTFKFSWVRLDLWEIKSQNGKQKAPGFQAGENTLLQRHSHSSGIATIAKPTIVCDKRQTATKFSCQYSDSFSTAVIIRNKGKNITTLYLLSALAAAESFHRLHSLLKCYSNLRAICDWMTARWAVLRHCVCELVYTRNTNIYVHSWYSKQFIMDIIHTICMQNTHLHARTCTCGTASNVSWFHVKITK